MKIWQLELSSDKNSGFVIKDSAGIIVDPVFDAGALWHKPADKLIGGFVASSLEGAVRVSVITSGSLCVWFQAGTFKALHIQKLAAVIHSHTLESVAE